MEILWPFHNIWIRTDCISFFSNFQSSWFEARKFTAWWEEQHQSGGFWYGQLAAWSFNVRDELWLAALCVSRSDSGKSPCLSKLPANLSTCFTRENAAVFPALYATALYISSYVVCIWLLMVQSTVICKIKGGKLFGVFNFMRVWQPHGFGPYPILHWKDSILI